MPKPISFRPSFLDQRIIEKLKEKMELETNADVVRKAITAYAYEQLGEKEVLQLVKESLDLR